MSTYFSSQSSTSSLALLRQDDLHLFNQSSLAYWLAATSTQLKKPLLVIVENNKQLSQLHAALQFFAPTLKVLDFPDWETLPYDRLSPTPENIAQRLLTLSQIPVLQQGILIASATSISQRLAPSTYINAHTFHFHKKDSIDLQYLKTQLAESSYQRVSQIKLPGEFAVRGSTIDIFPSSSLRAFRLDMDGDKIDSLRYFDPKTQQVCAPCDRVYITPAREFSLSEESLHLFRTQWQTQWDKQFTNSPVYQQLTALSYPAGIEYYLPLFFEKAESLLDYLSPHTHCFLLAGAKQQLDVLWQQIQLRYEQLQHDASWPLLPPERLYQSPKALLQHLQDFSTQQINLSNTSTISDLSQPHHSAFKIERLPKISAQDEKSQTFLNLFKTVLSQHFANYKILFYATRPARKEALIQQLQAIDISLQSCKDWNDFTSSQARFHISLAPLQEGFSLPDKHIALIPDSYILDQTATAVLAHTQFSKPHLSSHQRLALSSIAELQVGHCVVHSEYGIGRYLGLETIKLDEQETEFISLAYDNQAKLYVPVTDIHLINRYNGQENPPLHSLNSERWKKTKHKTLIQLKDVAAELLDVYANRANSKGFAFPLPSEDYLKFSKAFRFEETPDQITAIDQVIADLCSDKSMDRLLCGDVGFGKTEVAMRAAFIVAHAGKQVAILTPTTLLAEQHYRNFRDRFSDWPIQIDWLSRFRSRSEIQNISLQLKTGALDIIIGTHALLSQQISFQNLGLVIVDEEHHFGVQHKERLKKLKKNIDILTLTATPIPRTLQMALSGLRDLSIIATPPPGRLPITSFIVKRNPTLIREAILRELLRGGQVYFVHNYIATLNRVTREISKLVPEAHIAVAHGQLPKHELEMRMTDFYQQRCNILICTSIVETGLDIPTANTLIVDQADHFGLAQLHQLRGRVGRARHQAYAYFLTASDQGLTHSDFSTQASTPRKSNEAHKRLAALGSLSELGAGFNLASHDLDIRGAGELFGKEQSGAVQGVGFPLYMELLDQTIESLKRGHEPDIALESPHGPTLNLYIPALFPQDYIPNVAERLHYYKRITQINDVSTLDLLQMELIDQYGLLPEAAKNLLRIHELKWQAKALGIEKLEVGSQAIKVEFTAEPTMDPVKLIRLIQKDSHIYQLKPPAKPNSGQQLYCKLANIAPKARLDTVTQLLNALAKD